MEKTFSLEESGKPDYHQQLLNIINDIELKVRVVNPDQALFNELHEKKVLDARKESKEFEEVRKDICESFGVPFDNEHIYIYTITTSKERRPRGH
jgi:hypothetical protein